jgi:phenylalanyl-tRNA synthetase alpha chain
MDYIKKLKEEIEKVETLTSLDLIRRAFLGRKGEITKLLRGIKDLPQSERGVKGIEYQEIKNKAEAIIDKRQEYLMSGEKEILIKESEELRSHNVPKIGHLHPITKVIREMNELFIGMGYSVMEGPELETDEYCFERLGVPIGHPARDMHDTLYIEEPTHLLRTHTSSVEARVLSTYSPPFKCVVSGRVYRNEKVNKSNHFIFHHYQGFVVLPTVSLKDLFGVFTTLFRSLYGDDVIIRFRSKYYPEVEPGVGPDMQCFKCKGDGCALCKGVGWIEMGGAGIIHPSVMRMAGIDPVEWRGFAFGLGLDRWVMAKYKITDIRTLLGSNLAYQPFIV